MTLHLATDKNKHLFDDTLEQMFDPVRWKP